jgi:RPA family protein
MLLKIGIAIKRAIIVGTGKYKGVQGEVTTYRNEDGSYKQILHVKMGN